MARGLAKLGNKVYVIIPGYRRFKKEIDGLNVHGLKGILPKRLLKLFSRVIGEFYSLVDGFDVC